ncbi:SLBB domain-containing protein [Gammaproteobacteria bacterium]|nr:SLBB domain-containing protein [Gammaproteobacteria bacterium]
MKIFKNLSLAFILSMGMITLHAQIDEIGMLGEFVEDFSEVKRDIPRLPDSEEGFGEEINESVLKQNSELTNNNFGYSSGNTFLQKQRPKFNDLPLSVFGYDFFAFRPSTFSQLKNTPIPPDYIIGPGDNLKILLFGNANDEFTVQVTREGDILFPNLGKIYVAGLTFDQMQSNLKNIVKNKIIGAEINVSLGLLRAMNIYVLGDVFQPGMYTVSGLTSLTNAILTSGGISQFGSLRDIQLKRNGELIHNFDFYDLLLNGDNSADTRLRSGDVIFIPPKGKTVAIRGEVSRPGIYELKDSENLRDVISFAGRLKPSANRNKIEIQRIDESLDAYKLIRTDLSTEDLQLKNGDYIGVFSVNDKMRQSVLVTGHALNPGFYPWYEEMKVSDIFSSREDLLSMTDLQYLLIKRQQDTSQDYDFLQIDLEKVFQDKSSDENIKLHERDEILLLPRLLSPSLITTKLIQDEYELQGNEIKLKDEWQSLTYLRRSLSDENIEISKNEPSFGLSEIPEDTSLSQDASNSESYYEYSIYDYCILPKELAISVVEYSGFEIEQTISLDELKGLKTPQDFNSLIALIETDQANNEKNQKDESVEVTLTSECRKQLLDPYLRIVDRQTNKTNSLEIIEVNGNVHFPGRYPLTKKMTLTDAVKSAGGYKDSSYYYEVELSTIEPSGKELKASNTYISMNSSQENEQILSAMDHINIKKMNNDIKTAFIGGEVLFPGEYRLTGGETLKDLIDRAGGIKSNGSIEAAYFQRESLRLAEKDRLESARRELRRKIVLSSQNAGLGQANLESDSVTQLTQLILTDDVDESKLGRLVIDLNAIIEGSDSLILEDGDRLSIPKVRQTVSVLGEVYVPNSHLHNPSLSLDDYLLLSGGSNEFADLDSVYMIKSDGSIQTINGNNSATGFFRSGVSIIEPGDTIIVPVQIQPFNAIRASTEITQIIYQMAIAAAAVNSF